MYALRRTTALSPSLSTIHSRQLSSVVVGACVPSGNTSGSTLPAGAAVPVRPPLHSLRKLLTMTSAPWSAGVVPGMPITRHISTLGTVGRNRLLTIPIMLQVVPSIINTSPSSSALMKPSWMDAVQEWLQQGLYWISTLKRRRKMMNKHKLRKRRKKNRMKNK